MNMLSKKEKYTLDQEIDRVIDELKRINDPSTPEYKAASENLVRLCEARGIKSHKSLSYDTILNVVGNLAGILIVLNFERVGNIVTTKAFGMIGKGSKGA